MIHISLGNVGSGKTLSIVREMALNTNKRLTYANIKTKKLPNVKTITADMILEKNQIGEKKKRDGTLEPVYETKLNIDYWRSIKEPINVVLDEAHSLLNARRAMSKTNEILTQWLALLRRVLGQDSRGYGTLTLITQLPNRLDVISRDMATQVRYHVCYWDKVCIKCNTAWVENSDMPEVYWNCPRCNSHNLKMINHRIEVMKFPNMSAYTSWQEWGQKSYYAHYMINDVTEYFGYYDTLQWEGLFDDNY